VSDYPFEWESDVVLGDGGVARLRPARIDDEAAVLDLYERLSDDSIYLRFFSPVPRKTAVQFERLTTVDYADRMVMVAEVGGKVLAIARYDRTTPHEAEVAFAVADEQHGRGLATLLLEHLAVVARSHGIHVFAADTLARNRKMLDVFISAGWETERAIDHDTVRVRIGIDPTPVSIDAVHTREHHAEMASIARLLAPRSIAVVGASRRPGTIGHELFRNLIDYDFEGPVYPVNPEAASVAGVRAYVNVSAIPDPVDLAIVVVPAPAVRAVVEECAQRRVDDDGKTAERALVEIARRHGLRVVGPNCLGVVNTAPAVRMNATFSPATPVAGNVAFMSQSGGLGIELMSRAVSLGIGISSFVSVGNKADVSGNDLLQYWADDPRTDVILLYLESFGNPRKFARLARRVSHTKPIVVVKSGRSAAGGRAASSHTAALAAPDVAVDALFRQAGVIRVDTLDELLATTMVLAHQPLPHGRRVAIVSNAGGPAILAADACSGAGLEVPELSAATQAALRKLVSRDASVRNPIDLVAGATAEQFEAAMGAVLRDDAIDALIPVFVPPLVTRAQDVAAAIVRAAQVAPAKPIAACFLGQSGVPDELRGDAGRRTIPSYTFPESAAYALGRAADLADWRARPSGHVPPFDDDDVGAARAEVTRALDAAADASAAVWLDPTAAASVLSSFGIPIAPFAVVETADAATAAARKIGYPVALKTAAPAVVHKTEAGGVAVDLRDDRAVLDAFTTMQARLGASMGAVIVQQMVAAGVETIVGVTHDRSFGPLVLFGLGGITAELLADHALRIVPITDADAHDLVRSLRGSPLLFGYRGRPPVDVAALEDLVLRVGHLADEIPEIAEMDLNPVIAGPDGAVAVDVKIRVAPAPAALPPDLRRMRL
jgi:acetyl coenzyme A synthetase (ADP forming)-like protein